METNDLRKAVKHINQTAVTTVEEGIQKLLEQVPDNTGMKVSMVHLRHDEAGKLCGVKLSLESPVVFEDAQDLTDSSKAAMGGEPIDIYVTFGQVHTHNVDGKTLDKDCVAVIQAMDEEAGHFIAMEVFGGKFSVATKEKPDMSFYPRGLIYV